MPSILTILLWTGTAFGGLFLLIVFFAFLKFGALWFQALTSGAPVKMIQLIAMQLRRVDATRVVKARIMAHQAGIQSNEKSGIATQNLEAQTPDLLQAARRWSDSTSIMIFYILKCVPKVLQSRNLKVILKYSRLDRDILVLTPNTNAFFLMPGS